MSTCFPVVILLYKNCLHLLFYSVAFLLLPGFMGDNSWEQTLHDLVLENLYEASRFVEFLFRNKTQGGPAPPKNKEEAKEFCVKVLTLIQNQAEKRDKKYIVSDKVCSGGCGGDSNICSKLYTLFTQYNAQVQVNEMLIEGGSA